MKRYTFCIQLTEGSYVGSWEAFWTIDAMSRKKAIEAFKTFSWFKQLDGKIQWKVIQSSHDIGDIVP